MDEGTLGVHKIELVINTGEDFSDGGGVGDHANSTLNLSEITTWNNGGRLVVDTALEASGAPVDELDGTLGLDGGDSGVDILGDDITTVHHAACHVLAVTRIALDHHVSGLEGRVGDFSNGELLVVGLLGRDDRSIAGKHKVNTRIGDKVGLEFSKIDIESTIETEGSSKGRNNLGNKTVKVSVSRTLNIEGTTADIIDSFIVKHEADFSVVKKGVSGKDAVVGFNNGVGDLRRWVDSEGKLGLAAIINRETFKKERAETRTGTTTDGVEDQEALETSALISELADTVQRSTISLPMV